MLHDRTNEKLPTSTEPISATARVVFSYGAASAVLQTVKGIKFYFIEDHLRERDTVTLTWRSLRPLLIEYGLGWRVYANHIRIYGEANDIVAYIEDVE